MGEYRLPEFVVNYDQMASDFLCARPRRLFGAARVLDLFGMFTVYNQSATPPEADAKATFSDWIMVGRDIQDAIRFYEMGHQK